MLIHTQIETAIRETALTGADLSALCAFITGGPKKRAANREAAARRFAKLLAERIGEERAEGAVPYILGAPGPETAEGRLHSEIDDAEMSAAELDTYPTNGTPADQGAWAARQDDAARADLTPGLARLRSAEGAEALRQDIVAEHAKARTEAAAKIAAEAAAPAAPRKAAGGRERREDSLVVGSKAAEAVDRALRPEGVTVEELKEVLGRPSLIKAYCWDAGCSVEKREGRYFAVRVGRKALSADPKVAAYFAKWGHVIEDEVGA